MLCHKIVGVIACVEVAGQVLYIETRFGKIFQRFLKKLVVVCLEVYFAAVGKKSTVLVKLPCVGKPALVVLVLGPRVAEIDVQPVCAVVLAEIVGNSLDIA